MTLTNKLINFSTKSRKKSDLGPKLEQKKSVLSEFEKIENEYKAKKVSFLGTTGKIEEDIK